jgi:hypothetical protein
MAGNKYLNAVKGKKGKVGSRASTITEDSPQFDPVTMGNRKYGPNTRRPDGSVMKRGTGPGPNGSYNKMYRLRKAARGRGPDFEGGFGPYAYNKRYKGKGIDRQLGA